ncbi:hypothetical protein CCHR01_10199 [Colletotrichum chrysophilum]|uniref:DUF7708 domain-containing protein n=2 Tax=Colletotrichum chrysophilum TaxID=1836956 RepID=A0AAD9EDG8_9PEZI|nr:hypothetical protein CCHR01_10199 [Colletotrichum chrysophilum]
MASLDRSTFLASRERQPSSSPIRFIENHVCIPGEPDPVHSPWAGRLVSHTEAEHGDDQRSALWKQADDEIAQLFKLMSEVRSKLARKESGNQPITRSLSHRGCSWDDVVEEIQATAQRWKQRTGKVGKSMEFINKIGNHSEALTAWLGLLPTGDYGSSICGVFKLIIGATANYSKVEEDIFQALSEIPDVMESTRRYVAIWTQRNQHFERLVFNLYRATLKSLRQIMQFFADSRLSKVLGAVIKQKDFKMDLSMSLREMRQCAENIGKEGQLYNAEETHDTFLMGERTELVVNKILQFLETHPLLQVNTAELRTMKAALEPISQYDLANVHRTSSDDSLRLFELQQLADEKAQKDRQEKAAADREALLQLIRFDPGVVQQDILRCAQSGYIMNDEQKSRAAAMIRNETFKSFLRDAHSSRSLLVNGNEDTARADGISPFSLVAAELSRLSDSAGAADAPVFVLNYFCAEHCPRPLFPSLEASAAGLMVSLIGQLVSQMKDKGMTVDLSFMAEKNWRRLERFDVKALCNLFKKLTKQLPPGAMLLCILDEVYLYESRENVEYVVWFLAGLAEKQRYSRAAFKLLVACRIRAMGFAKYFVQNTVDLDDDVEVDDAADWEIQRMTV